MKAGFTFTQTDWKPFAFLTIVLFALYTVLQRYFEVGMAVGLGAGIGMLLLFLFRKYMGAVVEFRQNFLQFKEGFSTEQVKVNYADISTISFTAGRFLNLEIVTANKKINLPPPPRLEKAEELFRWLATKNPAIEMDIKR